MAPDARAHDDMDKSSTAKSTDHITEVASNTTSTKKRRAKTAQPEDSEPEDLEDDNEDQNKVNDGSDVEVSHVHYRSSTCGTHN